MKVKFTQHSSDRNKYDYTLTYFGNEFRFSKLVGYDNKHLLVPYDLYPAETKNINGLTFVFNKSLDVYVILFGSMFVNSGTFDELQEMLISIDINVLS